MARRIKLRHKLMLLCGSLTLALLLAEGLYRWLGPKPFKDAELGYVDGTRASLGAIIKTLRERAEARGELAERPRGGLSKGAIRQWYDRPAGNYFAPDGSIELHVNSLGFRDEEFDRKKAAGELRLLCVGDSFTFGPGVLLEHTWPQQLEARLRETRSGPVQAINAGFAAGSYYTGGYPAWLASDGLDFDPDWLIVGFCLNDIHESVPMLGYLPAESEPWLGGVSALLTGIQKQLAIREAKAFNIAPLLSKLVADQPQLWHKSKAALKEIKALCDARGVKFLLAVFPMVTKLGEDYPYLALHKMVHEACREAGVDYVDLLPEFRHKDAESLWVHPTDQHPNPEGYRLIAKGIFEHMQAMK